MIKFNEKIVSKIAEEFIINCKDVNHAVNLIKKAIINTVDEPEVIFYNQVIEYILK